METRGHLLALTKRALWPLEWLSLAAVLMPGSNLQTATLQLDCSLWTWGEEGLRGWVFISSTHSAGVPAADWSCYMVVTRDFSSWLLLLSLVSIIPIGSSVASKRKCKAATGWAPGGNRTCAALGTGHRAWMPCQRYLGYSTHVWGRCLTAEPHTKNSPSSNRFGESGVSARSESSMLCVVNGKRVPLSPSLAL